MTAIFYCVAHVGMLRDVLGECEHIKQNFWVVRVPCK